MIGRRPPQDTETEVVTPKRFDDYELRLGDVMRGERATMGKSLLDVQRELRIKASYIAAIENCDPGAFDTPGFIAGYVRSYARYLSMDPDEAFETFCRESGFELPHGMSSQASGAKKSARDDRLKSVQGRDVFTSPATPFAPRGEALMSQVEPGAIGSVLVLVALISAIGFGGWSVLKEVQRVQVAPVEQAPVVLSDIDPLVGADAPGAPDLALAPVEDPGIDVSRSAALDRLYRPQALDVPVLVARDAPIATLDPGEIGAFAREGFSVPSVPPIASPADRFGLAAIAPDGAQPTVPQVVETVGPTLRMVAAYPSWVRVRSADGTTLFEGTLQAGDTWDVPATEAPPRLRTGESGAIYFAMGEDCFGPVGARGAISSDVPLEVAALSETLERVEPQDDDSALNRMFADLRQVDPTKLARLPCQTN